MKCEYLLFHVVVLTGPVLASFEKRLHFVARWPVALGACLIVMIPYGIWDRIVTGRHWSYNEAYIVNVRMAGLPVEEWLFFISVPFACLFVWENVRRLVSGRREPKLRILRGTLVLALPAGLLLFLTGKEYTALMVASLGVVALTDQLLDVHLLLQPRTYLFLVSVLGLTLLFNSYLTARPIVLYDESYQLGLRVGTIPVEDFGYAGGLLLLVAIVYERLRIHSFRVEPQTASLGTACDHSPEA